MSGLSMSHSSHSLTHQGGPKTDLLAGSNDCCPHAVKNLPPSLPGKWMTNSPIVHYQTLLLDTEWVKFLQISKLNPATLLPDSDDNTMSHDCSEVMASVSNMREDLTDTHLNESEVTVFTDGSSFIDTGRKRAGAAVVQINQLGTETKTIRAVSLPAGTSSQKIELIGLTQALILSRGKKATIYTDSRVRVCHHTRAWGNIQGERAAHLRRESHKKQRRDPQTPGCPLAVPATCNCTLPRTSKRCLT